MLFYQQIVTKIYYQKEVIHSVHFLLNGLYGRACCKLNNVHWILECTQLRNSTVYDITFILINQARLDQEIFFHQRERNVFKGKNGRNFRRNEENFLETLKHFGFHRKVFM